jgi:hypothetical protein
MLWPEDFHKMPLLFLRPPKEPHAYICLCVGLCVGCWQQLRIVTTKKGLLIRAMAATALAVIVCALSIAGASFPRFSARLFQSAALPFVMLCVLVEEDEKIDIEAAVSKKCILPTAVMTLPLSLYQGSQKLQQELRQQQTLMQMLRLPPGRKINFLV